MKLGHAAGERLIRATGLLVPIGFYAVNLWLLRHDWWREWLGLVDITGWVWAVAVVQSFFLAIAILFVAGCGYALLCGLVWVWAWVWHGQTDL